MRKDGANQTNPNETRPMPIAQPGAPRFIFTITGGRTGTEWLARFLGASLGVDAIHELLGIDDFGTRMPDIRLMRIFNERGNTDAVRAFWAGKLAEIASLPCYVETNHTLAKCGLVENLAASPLAPEAMLIVLRRDLAAQCKSYLARGDFLNVTINWQWYLHATYPNAILNPQPFLPMGQLGHALWYTYEMDLRQNWYLANYADTLRFVDVRLEDIVCEAGARRLLDDLGFADRAPVLPPASNVGARKLDPRAAAQVDEVMTRIDYDPAALLAAYARDGRTLALAA